LSKEHFDIWLKIIGKDYVAGSRTFAKYKETYTSDYYSAKTMRANYIDDINYKLEPHSILYDHWEYTNKIKELVMANKELVVKCDTYAMANKELVVKCDAYAMASDAYAMANKELVVKCDAYAMAIDAYAMANKELQEQVKKLKEYIRDAEI